MGITTEQKTKPTTIDKLPTASDDMLNTSFPRKKADDVTPQDTLTPQNTLTIKHLKIKINDQILSLRISVPQKIRMSAEEIQTNVINALREENTRQLYIEQFDIQIDQIQSDKPLIINNLSNKYAGIPVSNKLNIKAKHLLLHNCKLGEGVELSLNTGETYIYNCSLSSNIENPTKLTGSVKSLSFINDKHIDKTKKNCFDLRNLKLYRYNVHFYSYLRDIKRVSGVIENAPPDASANYIRTNNQYILQSIIDKNPPYTGYVKSIQTIPPGFDLKRNKFIYGYHNTLTWPTKKITFGSNKELTTDDKTKIMQIINMRSLMTKVDKDELTKLINKYELTIDKLEYTPKARLLKNLNYDKGYYGIPFGKCPTIINAKFYDKNILSDKFKFENCLTLSS